MSPLPRISATLIVSATLLVTAVVLASLVAPPKADASYLIGRDLRNVSMKVSKNGGVALVTYKVGKGKNTKRKRLLAWGAINAVKGKNRPQFSVDRTGGWKTNGRHGHWKTFKNYCKKYRGPKALRFTHRKCTRVWKGKQHHWAIQKWRRIKPNYGGTSGPMEYRLSHFSGPLPELKATTHWHDTRKDPGTRNHALQMYGSYTYRGKPVFGQKWTRVGYVLDAKGRNITLEALSPDYPGRKGVWTRVNMFLAHRPSGQFCFLFGPKNDHGGLKSWQQANLKLTGRSTVEKYRMSVPGPGVAPDVFIWFKGKEPGSYDAKENAVHLRNRAALAPAGVAPNCQG